MLVDLISLAQAENEEAMMELIARFEKLLKKYARRLNYEDALNDLTLEFIHVVRVIKLDCLASSNDGVLVNYIIRSLNNRYYKLGKQAAEKNYQETGFSELSEEQLHKLEEQSATSGTDEWFEFLSHIQAGVLTEREQFILTQEFFFGLGSAEIAEKEGISRQSVNQMKQRALKKLRMVIDKEGHCAKEYK